jgi:uncharacterized SAM-binding protein YcdF (DUF218 family)
MFFYLSKIFWWLVLPINVVFLLLVVGVVCLVFQRRGLALTSMSVAVFIYVVFGMLPIGSYLLQTLEDRFPAVVKMQDNIAGIIVLGGTLNPVTSEQRGQLMINGNVERVLSLIELSKYYKNIPIVYSGGSGLIGRPDLKEAAMMKPLLQFLINNPENLILENESRNTFENAAFTKKVLGDKSSGKWVLVTSARHMPRAVGAFRHQGVDVLAYPVDYLTGKNTQLGWSINPAAGLNVFTTSLHEWLGLFAYYLTDKTTELFPSP